MLSIVLTSMGWLFASSSIVSFFSVSSVLVRLMPWPQRHHCQTQ
jgi:hypothetical protein